jgi:hypothetical protein
LPAREFHARHSNIPLVPVHPPFADLPLAKRLEFTEGNGNACFIDARVRHDPAGGAVRTTVCGTLAMFDGPGSPITQTFGLGIAQPATPAGLDELEQFFKSRGSDVFHEVSPLAGVDLLGTLATRGYRPIELSSVLYQPIDDWKARTANPKIRVRAVDLSEANLYSQIAARGWSESPEVQGFIEGFARISLECATCFVAEIDGTPIAAGAVFLHEGVALLAGASTVPDGRRQGAQLALLDTRLKFAASRGCDLAMMCAAPGSASQRNAERNGFRIAYTRAKWQL